MIHSGWRRETQGGQYKVFRGDALGFERRGSLDHGIPGGILLRIPYDTPRIHMYTRIRKGPFFYAHQRHGVQSYTVTNRQYHPRHYDDMLVEYWKLVNEVTMWDVAAERQVEITGPDAFEFTNMLTPRDLNKCDVGQCKYAFITAEDGGIINDPVLFGRQRRSSMVQGIGLQPEPQLGDPGARCGADPDTGTEVQGGHDRPLRRE